LLPDGGLCFLLFHPEKSRTMLHMNETSRPAHAAHRSAFQGAALRARRSVDDVLKVLPSRASRAGNLYAKQLGPFPRCGALYEISKFVFVGPVGGDFRLRLGLFAGIHGDEEAGCHALAALLAELHENPSLARGLELHVYPVCNPSGYEDGTRWPRAGEDLNREFWKNSAQPEVRLLERELEGLRFDGIIALHADDTSDGTYGYVGGDVLTKNLLEPALVAAEEFLPRNRTPHIDGWNAENGIIEEGFSGILSAPASQQPRPFEIVFETPALGDPDLQVQANLAAIYAIFEAAQSLRAHAANI
jgi:hypothetical protein